MGTFGLIMLFGSLAIGAIVFWKLAVWMANAPTPPDSDESAIAGILCIVFFIGFVVCMGFIAWNGYKLAQNNLCVEQVEDR